MMSLFPPPPPLSPTPTHTYTPPTSCLDGDGLIFYTVFIVLSPQSREILASLLEIQLHVAHAGLECK